MTTLVEHITWRIKTRLHLRAAGAVLATPPVVPLDDGVVIFSMIGTRVLPPYLIAAKSLHHWLGLGRFVILDDGSLTARDKAVVARHLGDPAIHDIGDVDTGPAPRGGTWERLLTLLDLRGQDYVIQLDSDTVTLGPVPEVAAAVAAGRSFTLFGDERGEALGVLDAAAFGGGGTSRHVQALAEAALADVAIPDLRYVRGCAAFAGFAPSDQGRALALAFSQEAERLLGRAKWSEWGSEQVTSNVVIANEPDPALLPYARYANYWNAPLGDEVAFAHFIGTYRHHGSAYLDATRAAIAALRA